MRVKRGVAKRKRRKKIIKQAKGYKWRRKSTFKAAKQAVMKALTYQYRDRRTKKRNFRREWQNIINQEARKLGTNYSRFINNLKKNNIELDRKILAQLAIKEPKLFKRLLEDYKQTPTSQS